MCKITGNVASLDVTQPVHVEFQPLKQTQFLFADELKVFSFISGILSVTPVFSSNTRAASPHLEIDFKSQIISK